MAAQADQPHVGPQAPLSGARHTAGDAAPQLTPRPAQGWAHEIVWGWDPLPGLVGLWVERTGRVTRWRRDPTTGALTREQTRFRPWALLPSLKGLDGVGLPLRPQPSGETAATEYADGRPASPTAPADAALWWRELVGPGRLRYLVSAPHADILERALRQALHHTLGRPVTRLGAVDPDELLLLPLEDQYLTQTGQVYFRDLSWQQVRRLTFDLETEGLDPQRHRLFLIAVRVSADHAAAQTWTLDVGEGEARGLAGDAAEADLLRRFVALVQRQDPDVLENHNLAGFDLPFLMERARQLKVPLALQRAGLPLPFFRQAAPRRAWGSWRSGSAEPSAPRSLRAADTTLAGPTLWQRASHSSHSPQASPWADGVDVALDEDHEDHEDQAPHTEPSARSGAAAAMAPPRRGRVVAPGREIIDTLDAVRRYDFSARTLPGHGLKAVARALGVAPAEREYIEGAQVSETWRVDPARVRRYAQDDVTEAAAISALLGGPAFALAQMVPRRYERVAEAGPATGILDPLLVRAYLRAGAALPAYQPRPSDVNVPPMEREVPGVSGSAAAPDEPHTGGATYLFAAGVARQVVKCDIASLYPSLIRHFQVGPQRDSLGAFLTLVDQLVEQRLAAKRRAQTAVAGSIEQKTQAGLAAGLKIVINAAYGYLAAPGLCRLAEVAAANVVTAHGRATLDHLCRELVARGVTLLEADTDGVYFSVPSGWREADERQCVAEVGQTLPPLVRLEYEARYASGLFHEIKNYATLGYDGRLTARGVAFHSRRMEPYGEAFLLAAVRCLLAGNVPGVRAAYLETIARLRRRDIPIEEVTIRARLTKTPERYQRLRPTRREAAYEALLASGRRQWEVGASVQYYCVGGGRFSLWRPQRDDDGIAAVETTPDLPHLPQFPAAARGTHANDRATPYDVRYYCAQLRTMYAQRLARAFTPDDFATLFANPDQPSLFATPLETIQPRLTTLLGMDALQQSAPPRPA